MEGSPSPADRLKDLLGKVKRRPSINQVRAHRRYPVYRTYGATHAHFEVLLGFWFPGGGFPQLGLELNSYPESAGGGAIARAIRSLRGRTALGGAATWRGFDADNWAGSMVRVPLGSLLVGDDHVGRVRAALLDLADELAAVMRLPETAALPWTAPEEGGDEE